MSDSGIERALLSAQEQARRLDAGGNRSEQSSAPNRDRRGIVSAVSGTRYTVQIMGADGVSVADTIKGVRVWGQGGFSIGDRVVLKYEGDSPLAFLDTTSGGGARARRTYLPISVEV